MELEFWPDALEKFTDEGLLACVIVCILLAILAYALFGKSQSEKIKLSVFVLVAVFFGGFIVSASGYLRPQFEAEPTINPVAPAGFQQVTVPASAFKGSIGISVGPLPNLYGADVVMNSPPFESKPNAVFYEFAELLGGYYEISLRLAAEEVRPLEISVNGDTVIENAEYPSTGGWLPSHQDWVSVGLVSLQQGSNVIALSNPTAFPHITKVRITRRIP